MPPIRSEKSNSAADAPAPGTVAPKKRLLKPVVKGIKDANFLSSVNNWDGEYDKLIGTSTRTISFGSMFVLTDDHIDDILALPRQNDAKELTDEAVVRLAKGLPNLRTVILQSTTKVGDEGFLALVSNCPDLRLLEITPLGYGPKVTKEALEEFCKHPEWCPGLKQVIFHRGDEYNKEWMKPMRELGKQRDKMVITLLDRSEVKKWGDWEISTSPQHYVKGRKCEFMKVPRGIAHRHGSIY
ncbi:hypothetical protein ACHAP8_007491 [Fusarium lateritium]